MKKKETKTEEKKVIQPEAEVEAPAQAEAEAQPSEAEQLKKQLEEALAQKDEYLKMAQYSRAEFDNFRKRNASVRADALAEGTAQAVIHLLPVVDDLERAVNAGGEGSFYDGVVMVLKRFTDILGSMGVAEIPCKGGDPFDPNLHNAVLDGPVDDDHPDGTVLAVFQKGYQYKDKILRHTMVQVAKA